MIGDSLKKLVESAITTLLTLIPVSRSGHVESFSILLKI